MRLAVERTQSLSSDAELLQVNADVRADPPNKDIHTFIGTLAIRSLPGSAAVVENGDDDGESDEEAALRQANDYPVEPLTAENMLWANTVLAAGTAVGAIVYTGRETRAVMNTSQPGTKTGLLDEEINRLAKVSCCE